MILRRFSIVLIKSILIFSLTLSAPSSGFFCGSAGNFPEQAKLMVAIKKGRFKSVAKLIAKTDVLNVLDVNDSNLKTTPLYFAFDHKRLKIFQLLLDHDKTDANIIPLGQEHLLLKAARNGATKFIAALLASKKVDINFVNEHNLSALILAAEAGHLEIVKLLLEHKADVEIAAANGSGTALYWAVRKKHWGIVDLLLKAGARPQEKTLKGQWQNDDLLFSALLASKHEIAQMLGGGKGQTQLCQHSTQRLQISLETKKHTDLDLLLVVFLHCESDLREVIKIENEFFLRGVLSDYYSWMINDKKQNLIGGYLEPKFLKDLSNGEEKSDSKTRLADCCGICFDEEEAASMSLAQDCYCSYCAPCIQEYVRHELESNGRTVSVCPQPGCAKAIDWRFLKKFGLDHGMLNKFREKQLSKNLALLKDWSFCPTPNCINGKNKLSPSDNYFSCAVCKFEGCISCGDKHEGGQCESYRQGKERILEMLRLGAQVPPLSHPNIYDADVLNKAHADYFKGRFRPCPTCGAIIEKPRNGREEHGQCNKMKCAKCHTDFDWNFGVGRKGGDIWLRDRQHYRPKAPPHI